MSPTVPVREGLEFCISLEEVYLSHNGITRLEVRFRYGSAKQHRCVPQGLQSLSKLRVLDVSSNRVAKVEGLEAQTTLEDLWLNDNQLDEWDGLYESLEGPRQTLTTIYLENNPIVRIVFTPTLSSQSLFAGRTSELQDTCACNATQADAVRCRRSSNMKAR